MDNLPYRRQQRAPWRSGADPSAPLHHSKSGSAAVASRAHSGREKVPISSAKKTRKKQEADGGDGGFITFLPRSRSHMEVPRRTRSGATSPSAWALSPGRQSPWSSPALVPQTPSRVVKSTKRETKGGGGGGGGGGRGVSGVLKYFRQKKVSPELEEDYHRYRVAYNRLLQWRFANSRAEASMAAAGRIAQKRLWNGWIKISIMRNAMAEKRVQVQKAKQQLKTYKIIKSETRLLEEWSRIEKRNAEAVGRVVRKLSAVSACLPLVENAQGGTGAVDSAISTAREVMDSMEAVIQDMQWQVKVEKTCFLLTELSVILSQQKQSFQELEMNVVHAASVAAQEKILRAQQIQLGNQGNVVDP